MFWFHQLSSCRIVIIVRRIFYVDRLRYGNWSIYLPALGASLLHHSKLQNKSSTVHSKFVFEWRGVSINGNDSHANGNWSIDSKYCGKWEDKSMWIRSILTNQVETERSKLIDRCRKWMLLNCWLDRQLLRHRLVLHKSRWQGVTWLNRKVIKRVWGELNKTPSVEGMKRTEEAVAVGLPWNEPSDPDRMIMMGAGGLFGCSVGLPSRWGQELQWQANLSGN